MLSQSGSVLQPNLPTSRLTTGSSHLEKVASVRGSLGLAHAIYSPPLSHLHLHHRHFTNSVWPMFNRVDLQAIYASQLAGLLRAVQLMGCSPPACMRDLGAPCNHCLPCYSLADDAFFMEFCCSGLILQELPCLWISAEDINIYYAHVPSVHLKTLTLCLVHKSFSSLA